CAPFPRCVMDINSPDQRDVGRSAHLTQLQPSLAASHSHTLPTELLMVFYSWSLVRGPSFVVPHSWPLICGPSFMVTHSWRFMYGISLMFLPLCANLNRDTLTSPLMRARVHPQTHPPNSPPSSFPDSPPAPPFPLTPAAGFIRRSSPLNNNRVQSNYTAKDATRQSVALFPRRNFDDKFFSRCARRAREFVADRNRAPSAAELACSFAR
ncbi:MAG: hypothetical protein RL591_558, partial [Planctomycetota bacterium]